MEQNFPIVFLYRGNRNFLPYTLYQAKRTNPDARIILLGDNLNRHYKAICEHYSCDDFLQYSKKLKEVYRHKSQWGEDFEYVCIERWFILHEFMLKHNLENAILLDSDILVYNNLNRVKEEFPHYNMTWLGFSAHVNFIKNREILKQYCEFVLKNYRNQDNNFEDERLIYSKIVTGKSQGNISDMTFFHDFNITYPNNLHNIAIPFKNQMFDITIDVAQGMELDGKFKKIVWKGKIPFAVEKSSNTLIQMHTFHCSPKQTIKSYFNYNGTYFMAFNLYCRIVLFFQRLNRKISSRFKSKG